MTRTQEKGAVSIFIVIFTALLVTIVTSSFIQIMVRNQQQASNNDLSQSAYDSALAGVEDAKRALVKLRDCAQASAQCEAQVRADLNSQSCESLKNAVGAQFVDGEVQVGDNATLNQAYTCVKVQLDTQSVDGTLSGDDGSKVVKLAGTGPFDKIRLSWYTHEDLKQANGVNATPQFDTNPVDLPAHDTWPTNQPPVLRAQLIQFTKGNITLPSFNAVDSNNAKTLFFYPTDTGAANTSDFSRDTRRDVASRNKPQLASCATDFTTSAYLCSMTIAVPDMPNREAYLQLAAFYNNAHYKIELLNGATVVNFDGVQPIVDATGRASDLFRRVKARISVSDGGVSLQFPDAALSLDGNLCKNFSVTNDAGDYRSADCDPASAPVAP